MLSNQEKSVLPAVQAKGRPKLPSRGPGACPMRTLRVFTAAPLAQLSHPSIVTIVEKGKTKPMGRVPATYFLVMEFVEGPSLREVMRKPSLDSMSAAKILLDVCRAIHYAHSRGVIHRDLKP